MLRLHARRTSLKHVSDVRRSGWGTKRNQERTLRIRVKRDWFTRVLEAACEKGHKPRESRPVPSVEGSDAGFAGKVHGKNAKPAAVRLQWDPGECSVQ